MTDELGQMGGQDEEQTTTGGGLESEPLAGEGTDVDEAIVTQGPRAGGTGGVAGQGTAADEVER